MRNRFELLIFDWDGTLCDSIDGIVSCIQQSARNKQLEIPSVRQSRDVIGLSLDHAMMQLFPELAEKHVNRLVNEYRALYLSDERGIAPLFDGVPKLLSDLRLAGYKLAIATGKSRQGLEHALEATNASGYFDMVCCGDEVSSKPAPDMLHKLLKEGEVVAEKALMVGDSWLDLEMASNAGIDSVAVSSGVHSRAELMPFKPVLCLDEVRELAESLL
jgi:phosphoglycolate phosphatase